MREELLDRYPDEELLFADGLDDAIIGVDARTHRVVYDVKDVIEILRDQGMSELEAMEYFQFNIRDAYVGDKTPIFVR
jgi:hypothetical protein